MSSDWQSKFGLSGAVSWPFDAKPHSAPPSWLLSTAVVCEPSWLEAIA
jgi:hypothetical protein